MDLTLNVLRCPDSAVPESRHSTGADLAIGRGLECDWVLPDPERLLSKRHCVLEFRGGFWQVRDLSTNGTFVNHAEQPIGRDLVAPLSDGDRLRLGPWEIEVRVAAGATTGGWRASTPAGQPSPDPFADPLAGPLPGTGGFGAPAASFGGAPAGGFGARADQFASPPAMGFGGGTDPFGAAPPQGFGGGADPFGTAPSQGFGGGQPPFGNAPAGGFGGGADPFAAAPAQGFGAPSGGSFGAPLPGGGPMIPDDFGLDDLHPVADHQAAASDAFTAPRATPASKIPDDWDLGFDIKAPAPTPAGPAAPHAMAPAPASMPPPSPPEAFAAPAAPFAPPPAAPAMPPAMAEVPPQPTPIATPPAAPVPVAVIGPDSQFDPFAEDGVPPAPAATPVTIPVAPVATLAEEVPAMAPPLAAPAVQAPQPVAPPPLPAVGAMPADAALAALLQGAGLSPSALPPGTDPAAVLAAAGAALRAAVAGLRALLIARADVKREFRIEQTMLRSTGNNPVKFAPDDESALVALLRHGSGPRSVQETVDDLTAHQVAALAATQAGARALLDKLAPAGLEAQEQGGGGLFGASREKRLWEAYKRQHGKLTEQFEDDFDSAFGKEFARAYEQASRRQGPG